MADWSFEREYLPAPKSRQRVRVTASVTTPGAALNPRNFEHRQGDYYEVYTRENDVWFRRSHSATPPFEFDIAITSSGDVSYPWTYALPGGAFVLLYTKAAMDSYARTSYDTGKTFTAEALVIAGGVKPYGVVCPWDGTEIIAAYLTASGKIAAKKREAGELNYGAAYNLKDDGGAELVFEDDTFSFWWGFRSDSPLVGHFHLDGEAQTSTWVSWDCGVSWKRLT